ncbi:potassium-transporting ATPase subunit C [Adhaeribacter arboris]|uniref:Potassium-transporting ATPase KdpC subunit n=1 Tax=Adhaeribacter arboris TaxID=2072846 RepID=A0A2T2YE61_9BACT|nr:K(+)-transporting ATPase subunit C [Adhaeribacter arboris]PSR53794.1 potassium-transporting ATPase subunit C [Adhaeribacter arboris]
MKTYLMPSLKLTFVLLLICSVIYPLVVAGIGKLAPGQGDGVKLSHNSRVVGYENIGQAFTQPQYFQGRPSAVDYNAAGSAGSNKGPSNPDYLAVVKARVDTFLLQNPTVKRAEVPSELVTASGSGLDPDLSVAAATVQINRVATARNLPKEKVAALVKQHTQAPLLGFLGPEKINVLKLNIALDELSAGK